MGHVSISHHEYEKLNQVFDHESTQFYYHQFELAKDYRLSHDDQLPQNKFWDYLTYRHDLNPARFDHFHERVGKWIEESETVIPPVVTLPYCPIVPPECTPSTPVMPPSLGGGFPVVTPEPSSMVLLAIAVIVGGVFIITSHYLIKKRIDL